VGGSSAAARPIPDGSGAGDALYIGGRFSVAGGVPQRNLARLTDPCATCAPEIAPYCVGETSSLGCVPHVSTQGLPSVTSTVGPSTGST